MAEPTLPLQDYEIGESMVNFVVEKNYLLRITSYGIWLEYYNILQSKNNIKPNISPRIMREKFIYEILPNVNSLKLTAECRKILRKFSTSEHCQFLEVSNNGYKLRGKTPLGGNMESELELCNIRYESEFQSEPVVAFIDCDYLEELVHFICSDKKIIFYLTLMVQNEAEMFNRVEIPIKEIIRRLLRIRIHYKKTNKFPSSWNQLPNFENILEYNRVLKWFIDHIQYNICEHLFEKSQPETIQSVSSTDEII